MVHYSPAFVQTIGSLCVVTSVMLNLSGVFICHQIEAKESSENFSFAPFLTGLLRSGLWMHYGLMIDNLIVTIRNFSGVVLFVIYSFWYIYFSLNWVYKSLQFAVTFVLMLVIIAVIHTSIQDKVHTEGVIATFFNILFRASPLMTIKKVIETKSTEFLPFPMIFLGFITSVLSFYHGFLIHDGFIIFNGGLTGLISLSQLMLFIIYPTCEGIHKKEKDP